MHTVADAELRRLEAAPAAAAPAQAKAKQRTPGSGAGGRAKKAAAGSAGQRTLFSMLAPAGELPGAQAWCSGLVCIHAMSASAGKKGAAGQAPAPPAAAGVCFPGSLCVK